VNQSSMSNVTIIALYCLCIFRDDLLPFDNKGKESLLIKDFIRQVIIEIQLFL
jgi:hypothetical protein